MGSRLSGSIGTYLSAHSLRAATRGDRPGVPMANFDEAPIQDRCDLMSIVKVAPAGGE